MHARQEMITEGGGKSSPLMTLIAQINEDERSAFISVISGKAPHFFAVFRFPEQDLPPTSVAYAFQVFLP
jgi:hypothetical protein